MATDNSIDSQLSAIQDLGHDTAALAHAAYCMLEVGVAPKDRETLARLLIKLEELGKQIAQDADFVHVRNLASA